MSVLLETSAGDLVIDLLLEEAPKTCLNFLKLCKSKFYNFAPIYNIQQPSFFQTGDPLYPIGDGGSSCWGLADPGKQYFMPEKTKRNHERGSVSMVSSAKGLAGSQFFMSLNTNESFDRKHTVFGRLAEGFETLDVIASQPVDGDFRPLRDVRIKHTIILEDPFDDPPDFAGEPPESPLPSEAQLSTVRIEFDENLEETASIDEIEAKKRAREAEASALTLETLGDLPFASVRPPENILFVCKLNPVTSSEDLALIFGRFGKILSCQVVRDRRTGDSLQYAFIEFDLKEDAERAYFKMQGVLIDDRRIHVDFSQSVAKVPRSELGSITREERNDRQRHGRRGHERMKK
ncbi:putative RNA binding protein [Taphrina deformans PYCC 5710]|uniref:Peptidyl-prolyl cis-trans isomerase n=1 Tax=Taphrina deformans (strain PYCC 5710 / ATCC 11124 / CBS 356.35 / IMI 108563 / JCM 9778 / NBRC 8474) TaxID=1097556 RepID=R4X6G6_TAPDE|nr:putative RNA binding protein [Taphrina deformans PYCC 5710]|eukprot:CCG80675.1 putative RNA binding protein [Taphrina deformans PYCC 5710]